MSHDKAFHKKLTDQLTKHEGLRLKPYHCPAGKLTIGIARNLEDKGITDKVREQEGIMSFSVLQNSEIPVASRAVHVLQEETNFAQQVLKNASEDVWNEL